MKFLNALAVSLLCSQAAWSADLMDVYHQAVDNAPVLKAAAAERMAKREVLPQSRSLWLPRLDLNAAVAENRWEPRSGPSDDYRSQNWGIRVTQTLYNRSAGIQLEQAEKRVKLADVHYDAARLSLMLEVSRRYFAVLAARDTLEVTLTEKVAVKRQLEQAQKRFEVGVSAITDVREAQARYDGVISREIVARNRLDSAKEALQELTGVEVADLSTLVQEFPLHPPVPEDIEAWEQIARDNNQQISAARYAYRIAAAEMKKQSAARYPSLSLIGSYQRSESEAERFVDNDLAALTLQLDLPLYRGGDISSRVRQAGHQYRQAEDELERVLRSTLRTTRDAYRNVIASIARVEALGRSLVSSQTALKATEAGFEAGTRTIVDVLNAQQMLFQTQRDYANARYDYLVAMLALRQAAGTLEVGDLEKINQWMN